jgi:hypothetical protein
VSDTDTIRELRAELATLRGQNATPQEGCVHRDMILGESTVLVEFEVESGNPLCVLINGRWIDCADYLTESTCEFWKTEFLESYEAPSRHDFWEDAGRDSAFDDAHPALAEAARGLMSLGVRA